MKRYLGLAARSEFGDLYLSGDYEINVTPDQSTMEIHHPDTGDSLVIRLDKPASEIPDDAFSDWLKEHGDILDESGKPMTVRSLVEWWEDQLDGAWDDPSTMDDDSGMRSSDFFDNDRWNRYR